LRSNSNDDAKKLNYTTRNVGIFFFFGTATLISKFKLQKNGSIFIESHKKKNFFLEGVGEAITMLKIGVQEEKYWESSFSDNSIEIIQRH
jgi:hypothetical protein